MSDAIRLEGVTKTFGAKVAVRDLNMVVPRGAMVGFIGPNGAGKTTTIRMILYQPQPPFDAGSPDSAPREVLEMVQGLVSQQSQELDKFIEAKRAA